MKLRLQVPAFHRDKKPNLLSSLRKPRRLSDGKLKLKCSAAVRARPKLKAAAMRLDDAPGNGKTQTYASILCRGEGLEEISRRLRADARPVVDDA